MKQILTLLLVGGALTAAQAQNPKENRDVVLGGNGGYGNNRDVILGGGNNGNNYPSYPGNYPSNSSRQAQIDQVNREYEGKIQSIRNNPYLSYDEKQRAVRQLERDRQRRIEEISRQYNGNYNGNGNNNCHSRDDRNNNSKRNGWYKKSKNDNWRKGNRD